MADNELTVVRADGATRTLRSFDLDGAGTSHADSSLVAEMPEAPADATGATVRYTVDADPAVALDPPTGGARYARLRVYHSGQDSTERLYYRQDGTAPTADGANAVGFLLHGEAMLVRIADFTDFQMIGETGMTGTFEVYVEWLDIPAS